MPTLFWTTSFRDRPIAFGPQTHKGKAETADLSKNQPNQFPALHIQKQTQTEKQKYKEMKRYYRPTIGAICCLALVAFVGSASAAPTEYSAGHGDIALRYENDELDLHFHFGDAILDGVVAPGSVRLNPSDVHVRVSDSAAVTLDSFSLPFLDAEVGDTVWILPESGFDAAPLGLPFLGINLTDLFDADETFSNIAYTMTDFDGPGNFGIYTTSGTVFMQSLDGVSDADRIPLSTGFHAHVNYGFSEVGVYNVELTATAEISSGETISDVETLTFLVGSATTAIPEPGSFAALASLGVAGMLVRRRRRSES